MQARDFSNNAFAKNKISYAKSTLNEMKALARSELLNLEEIRSNKYLYFHA